MYELYLYVCRYVYINVCTNLCAYMYARMYVCMYLCMCCICNCKMLEDLILHNATHVGMHVDHPGTKCSNSGTGRCWVNPHRYEASITVPI